MPTAREVPSYLRPLLSYAGSCWAKALDAVKNQPESTANKKPVRTGLIKEHEHSILIQNSQPFLQRTILHLCIVVSELSKIYYTSWAQATTGDTQCLLLRELPRKPRLVTAKHLMLQRWPWSWRKVPCPEPFCPRRDKSP